jgi:hypothetical protein
MKMTKSSLVPLLAAAIAAGVAASGALPEQPIEGGRFEASGVVSVAGTNTVLFVDDGRDDAIFVMELDGSGRQRSRAVAVSVPARVIDPEGITTDGIWYYVVGSQSKRNSAEGAGLIRFRFDPASRTASQVQQVSGLRDALLKQLPSVAAAAGDKVDGFNIEGLAWDPTRRRLLLGLRAPTLNGDAVIVPLAIEAERALDSRLLETQESELIRLPLDNRGIRSLEFDGDRKAFQLIAGGPDDARPFHVWQWSGGSGDSARLQASSEFAARLKPEGITSLGARTLLVFDTGKYLALD